MATVAAIVPMARLSDWQLAVLIVVLVAVPGAVADVEAANRRRPAAATAVSGQRIWTCRGAAVRPPRSC